MAQVWRIIFAMPRQPRLLDVRTAPPALLLVFLFLLFAPGSWAQGIITTVAGTDYIFPDDGLPAVQAHLAGANGMVFDRQGNLYFAEFDLCMIMKLDTKGVISVVAGSGLFRFAGDGGSARAASLSTPWGLAMDAAGNLYVADYQSSRVRKIDSSGIITTVVGGGSIPPVNGTLATQAALTNPAALAFDPSGNLLVADRQGSRLWRVTAGIMTLVAGNGQKNFSGDGGPATSAALNLPDGLAVAPDGTIYIADDNNGRIRRVSPNGIIDTYAGGGANATGNGVPATSISLVRPVALALDSQGNLFVADALGDRIRRIAPNGTTTIVAGTGQSGFSGDEASATSARLALPYALALDASGGNLYVADHENARIRHIDSNGVITTVAGQGAFVGDGGPAVQARFGSPADVAIDSQGNLYIADSSDQRIRKVTPGGQISTVAGSGYSGTSASSVQATSALMRNPAGVAIDPQGNLIIADSANGLVRRVDSSGLMTTVVSAVGTNIGHVAADPQGNIYYCASTEGATPSEILRKIAPNGTITIVAGNGQQGFGGDGGPAAAAPLTTFTITALLADAAGNVYFADSVNHRVRRIDSQGNLATVAGNGQSGDSGDGGPATSAGIGVPYGLAVDAAGNLYIATNSRIRRVSPDGTITAWAATVRSGFSGDGGPALDAAMNIVQGLAITPQGNLYVSDYRNTRVRLIQSGPSPSIVTSQKGLTFISSAAGGASPAPQSVTIVNGGQGTLFWGLPVSTASGGNWLSVSPVSGSSPAGGAGPPVQVSVNPTGLAAGDYYGQIQILGNGAPNSPQSITVVLSVRSPGSGTGSIVQPSGLLFTAAAGGSIPASQSLTLTTLSSASVTFTGTVSFGAQAWFTLQPASGSAIAGKPATLQIVPNIAGLAAGVYNGNIALVFSDNSTQSVQLLLVISSGAAQSAYGAHTATTCAATKLLPLFTSLGSGFALFTGWPSPVEMKVVDDCAAALTAGRVVVTFSNGDPPLNLTSLGDGRWTGTWQAQTATAGVNITANAQSADQQLTGTTTVKGGLQQNANPPPVIAPGGVLNAASYSLNSSLAPGSLVSIFGSLLAQSAAQASALPLPTTLGQTSILIAGRKVPLQYAGATQANAMIPYDLPVNATHQVVAQRGTAISLPEPIGVVSSQSGVFTKDATGQGFGIVVRVAPDGTQSVVATDNPAHAGDALVIYCDGLGDVDPRQVAGTEVPVTPLSQTLEPVTVTIGGVPATVFFSGLTPGFTGLYQVNAFVPAGVTPGDNVPLVMTQSGRPSPTVSISVR